MSDRIENCFVCGEATGRAGAGEDSLFLESNDEVMLGPLHDLETRCDPSGDIQTIASLREQVGGLQARVGELESWHNENGPLPGGE